jgi:transposase
MSESLSIDSPWWGRTMPKAYSSDLRERAIELVEMEGASRHEAAELLGVSVSSAVRWVRRWHESGSAEAKPHGGSVSPLEEFAAEILALIAEQPDLTLMEIIAELRRRRIRTSRSSLWRFLDRHHMTVKKKPAGSRAASSRRRPRASTLDERARHV